MSAEVELYSALSSDTDVANEVDGRIYPDVAPQDSALPGIVFARISTEYVNTIHGTSVATRTSLDIWCTAETRIGAEELCDIVEPVVRAADFMTTGRRAEFSAEQQIWAAVLSVDFWE